MKEVCMELAPNTKASSIDEYKKVISEHLPEFIEESAICYGHNLQFEPWSIWSTDKNPEWWRQHNKVKHQRNDFYHQATLRNVLEALAALYLVNVYLEHVKLKESSQGMIQHVSDSIQHVPIQLDFYRINHMMAYMHE